MTNHKKYNMKLVNMLRSARTNATIEFLEVLNDGKTALAYDVYLIGMINSYRAIKICELLNIKIGKKASLRFSNSVTVGSCSDVLSIVSKHKKDLKKLHSDITKSHELNARNKLKLEVNKDADLTVLDTIQRDLLNMINDDDKQTNADKYNLNSYRKFK